MRVLVLGAYGLIGQEIVQALLAREHEVIGLGRDERVALHLFPNIQWHIADMRNLQTPQGWVPFVDGVDAVINASGALQTGGRDNVKSVQTDSILALIKACERRNLRFVQISASGASGDASTEFMRTKSVADTALKESSIDHVILRPGLVISAVSHGGTALIRMLAAMPLGLVLTMPEQQVQTVSAYDVARISADAAEGKLPSGTDVELAEETPHRLEDIIRSFRRWLGFPKPKFALSVPILLAMGMGKIADAFGHLGWRSPLRSTALTVMREDVLSDTSEWAKHGPPLMTLDETLAAIPSRMQDRWHAKLSLLFPMLIAMLSLFWIVSGIVGFLRLDEAASVLHGSAIPESLHQPFVLGGGVVDTALGLLILIRKYVGQACMGMILVTLGYLGMATLFTPHLWADPLGALVKTIPAIGLAMTVYMLKDAR